MLAVSLASWLVCRDVCSLACPLARKSLAKVARKATRIAPGIDPKSPPGALPGHPKSIQNRARRGPKWSQNRPLAPKGPRARFQARFRVPGGAPKIRGRLWEIPKRPPKIRQVSKMAPQTRKWGSRKIPRKFSGVFWAPRRLAAHAARAIFGRLVARLAREVRSDRFSVDFRSKSGSLARRPTRVSYGKNPYEFNVGPSRCESARASGKTSENLQNRLQNRPEIDRKRRVGSLGAALGTPSGRSERPLRAPSERPGATRGDSGDPAERLGATRGGAGFSVSIGGSVGPPGRARSFVPAVSAVDQFE